MTDETTTPQRWLYERLAAGASDEEARAAAVALLDRQERDERLDDLEGLDPLAAELAALAYRAGVRDAEEAIAKLIGPAATTLDAAVLREALRVGLVGAVGAGIKFDVGRLRGPDGARWVRPEHERGAGLLATARRIVTAERTP